MEIGRLKYGIFTIFSTREDLEKFIEEKEITEFQVVEKEFYKYVKYYGLDYKLPKQTKLQLLNKLPYRTQVLLQKLTKLSVNCKQEKIEAFITLLDIHLKPENIEDCIDCFLQANMNKVGVSK